MATIPYCVTTIERPYERAGWSSAEIGTVENAMETKESSANFNVKVRLSSDILHQCTTRVPCSGTGTLANLGRSVTAPRINGSLDGVGAGAQNEARLSGCLDSSFLPQGPFAIIFRGILKRSIQLALINLS